jgi:hypothetical protein
MSSDVIQVASTYQADLDTIKFYYVVSGRSPGAQVGSAVLPRRSWRPGDEVEGHEDAGGPGAAARRNKQNEEGVNGGNASPQRRAAAGGGGPRTCLGKRQRRSASLGGAVGRAAGGYKLHGGNATAGASGRRPGASIPLQRPSDRGGPLAWLRLRGR